MHQAVLEDPATQMLLELPHDEQRQPAALLLRSLQKARPVLAHELVEQRLFRPPTLVAVRTREPSYGCAGALTRLVPRYDDGSLPRPLGQRRPHAGSAVNDVGQLRAPSADVADDR